MADVVALRTGPAAEAVPPGSTAPDDAGRLADVRPLRGGKRREANDTGIVDPIQPAGPTRPTEPVGGLAQLRAAGLVRSASEPAPVRDDRFLPVVSELRTIFPGGGLRRGSAVAVLPGSASLLIALLVAASTHGSWCAVVGLPGLGLVAAAEAGIALDRLALVPDPGPEWPAVVGALLDGVDIVVAAPPGPVPAAVTARLAARARQRGSVLIPYAPEGAWPGADLTLRAGDHVWHGLGAGQGRLRRHELLVTVAGRGSASRTARAHLDLPRPGETTPIGQSIVEGVG